VYIQTFKTHTHKLKYNLSFKQHYNKQPASNEHRAILFIISQTISQHLRRKLRTYNTALATLRLCCKLTGADCLQNKQKGLIMTKNNNNTKTTNTQATEKSFNNEKRIVIFKNHKREPGSNDPMMRGEFTLDGKKYTINIWTKEKTKDDGSKEKYLQGTIKSGELQANATEDLSFCLEM